jgi:DNA invertase Pin-like site-specific DNA recombinase
MVLLRQPSWRLLRIAASSFNANASSFPSNDTIQSKIIALAFSMAAEIERDLISQRTK